MGIKQTPFHNLTEVIDGTIAYIWDGKLHNWEGPALIPEGISRKGEYHLYGMQNTKDEWKEMRQQREGIPYYKNQSMKASTIRL